MIIQGRAVNGSICVKESMTTEIKLIW